MTRQPTPSRRSMLALAPGVLVAASVAAGTPALAKPGNDLPAWQRRGKIVATESSIRIYEVRDRQGSIAGYTFSTADLSRAQQAVESVNAEMVSISEQKPESSDGQVGTLGFVETSKCLGEILLFIGGVVFPGLRAAQLAARLLRLVNKHGARKVARVLTGARGISSRTVEREILEVGAALVGLGFLKTCGEAMGR